MSKNIINTNSTSNNSTNKAIIWTKISAKEQLNGRSLQAQIIDTQQYCHKKGFEVLKEYSEIESGRTTKKLKFKEMIEFIEQQKEPVNLIIQSVDRLHLNFRSITAISRLRWDGKIIIHSVNDKRICSKSDSMQSFLYGKRNLSAAYKKAMPKIKKAVEEAYALMCQQHLNAK